MNFKDLQFSIGKFTTAAFSNVARKNPLQNQDTRALSNWIFEERNELYVMRMLTHHHSETHKAMEEWINEEPQVSNPEGNTDLKNIGNALLSLLKQQSTIEETYAAKYQQYRAMLKTVREREDVLTGARDRTRPLQSCIDSLTRSSSRVPITPDHSQDAEMEMGDFKRFALREAFYIRFNAIQEMAEKLSIIAGYGQYIVDLIDIEPTPAGQTHRRPYEKADEVEGILTDALATLEAWIPAEGTRRPTLTKPLEEFAVPAEGHNDRPRCENSRSESMPSSFPFSPNEPYSAPPLPRRPKTAPPPVASSIPDAKISYHKPDARTDLPEPPPAYSRAGVFSPPNSDEPPVRRDLPNSYVPTPAIEGTAEPVYHSQTDPTRPFKEDYIQPQHSKYQGRQYQKPDAPAENDTLNHAGSSSTLYNYSQLYRQVTRNQQRAPLQIPYNQFQHCQRRNLNICNNQFGSSPTPHKGSVG